MKNILKKILRIILSPFILPDYLQFRHQNDGRFPLRLADLYPQVKDKTIGTNFDRHYVYHVAWAIRKVLEIKPPVHTDISSSLFFCANLSASLPVKFYDFRPADLKLSGLECLAADLTNLPFETGSISSLSCLHTLEHIGLGRYGDPIDPSGDLKAIAELARVLAPGGSLLIAIPLGKPKIEYNAHRIYSYEQIIDYFHQLDLIEFSLIPDNAKAGGLIENADPQFVSEQKYACGCFWFKKPA